MDTNKMRDLKEFAEAATSGEWTCSDKHDGRFWHIQAGSQAIGATHAAGRKSPMAGVFEANARFIAAASPATVVALLSEIERLEHESQNLSNQVGECDRERRAFRAERDQLKAENEALRKEREGMVLVPEAPSEGLLMSMAIRQDHGLGVPGYYDQPLMQRANHGVSHARMVECALSDMRKLHEEVVGSGFYSPGKESDYAAMAKEASHG